LGRIAALLLALAAVAAADTLEERYEKKLTADFIKNVAWEQDYDAALRRSTESKRRIFAYFTRCYAP
jgi:ribosomal protein S17E